MPIVLRVENRKGKGPFQASNPLSYEADKAMRKMPIPAEDGGDLAPHWQAMRAGDAGAINACDYAFGFINRTQLDRWMRDALPRLLMYGFALCEYHVEPEDMIEGRSQVAFHYGRANIRHATT